MEINENLAKLIFREFDDSIKGTDIYNHEGSMWLIFTEERKWVVEFTNQKTLWYNYKHFTDILVLFGMELTEGAEYIKKWYEDKFIFNVGKNSERYINESLVDNIIDKGVKQTELSKRDFFPKDVLQNSVKKVDDSIKERLFFVEDTIQNGIKETKTTAAEHAPYIEKVVQNGVKVVEYYDGDAEVLVNDAIENGVKEVIEGTMQPFLINDVLRDGIKHIDYSILGSIYQKDHNVTTLDFTSKLEDTIQNGVKEISSVDCEYPRTTINVISNGVKYMMSGSEFKNKQVEDIIKYSKKL